MTLVLSNIYLQPHFPPEIPMESHEQHYSTSLWQTCTQTNLHDYREFLLPFPSTVGVQLCACVCARVRVHLFSSFNQAINSLMVILGTQKSCNKCMLTGWIILVFSAPCPLTASPSPGHLVTQTLDKYLLNEIINQHQLSRRCHCNNWLGQTDTWIPCGTLWHPWMPLDIWRSGREQTVVGFGHKRVRVGMGKAEQESLCLGWNGRAEWGRKQLSSRLALSIEKSVVKTITNNSNNNKKMTILKIDNPKVKC